MRGVAEQGTPGLLASATIPAVLTRAEGLTPRPGT